MKDVYKELMASFEFGSMNSNWNPLKIAFAFLEDSKHQKFNQNL